MSLFFFSLDHYGHNFRGCKPMFAVHQFCNYKLYSDGSRNLEMLIRIFRWFREAILEFLNEISHVT